MMMIMMMNLALTEYSIAQLQSSLPGLLTPSKARQIQHQSFVAALALAAQHASKAYVFSLQHEIHPTPRVQQCHLKRHVSLSHHFCCNNTAILLFDNPPPQKKNSTKNWDWLHQNFTQNWSFPPKRIDFTKALKPISVEIHCHLWYGSLWGRALRSWLEPVPGSLPAAWSNDSSPKKARKHTPRLALWEFGAKIHLLWSLLMIYKLLMLEIFQQYIGLQDNDLDSLHYKIIKSLKRT